MRCPKCHYLSFDPEPRCKNCGYDLEVADADLALKTSESADAPIPDLKLRDRTPASPPVTLELRRKPTRAAASSKGVAVKDRDDDFDHDTEEDDPPPARMTFIEEPDAVVLPDEPEIQLRQEEEVVAPPAVVAPPQPAATSVTAPPESRLLEMRPADPKLAAPRRAPHTTTEMPLFVKGIRDMDPDELPDEEPLRPQLPDVPPARQPLGVRRAAPETPRSLQKMFERRLGPLDRDLLEDLKRVEREEVAQIRADARAEITHASVDDGHVEPGQRLAAAAVDAGLLGGIAAFVVWATLRLCQVDMSAFGFAALIPLTMFLVIVNMAYLMMFTAAGGQTVGKMLMGLRVIAEGDDLAGHVSFRQATWRAALTILSIVPFGAGWLPSLLGNGVGLHDRFTHTRVVRA